MVRHRPQRSSSTTTGWLAGVGVAVVAVIVVVLVVLALQHARGDGTAAASPRPVPTLAEPSPTETPTPEPTPTQQPVAAPGADERLLAVGEGAMWRATAGECGGPAPVIEHSTDDGETWEDVTPTYRGIAQVLSLDPLAGDQAEMIARMGPSCEVQALRTFTYGRFWEPYPDVLAASTYIDPMNDGKVIRPDGTVDAPCMSAWGLRSQAGVVGLVCDGTAYRLLDDDTWEALVPDAVAIAIADDAVVPVTAAQATAPAAAWPVADGLLVWSGDALTPLVP